MRNDEQKRCACACGANAFSVKGEPLLRAVCHCHFCQDFNQADFGDFLIYREAQVTFEQDAETAYRSYKKPEIVSRGSCRQCGKPVLEYLRVPLFPRLVFVPTVNHPDKASLQEPALQMFYHRHVRDAGAQTPKYSGYVRSEIQFMGRLLAGLCRTAR